MFSGNRISNGDLYVGNNDYSKANFEQKAYHELFHHIIRNKSLDINNEFKSILNDYKSNPNELTSNVNNYLTSKNYNESLNEQGAKIFAEELLADYSAKHLANYNIDYQLYDSFYCIILMQVDVSH